MAASMLALAGCANIPSSSRPQVIAESVPASPPASNDDLRYDELVPRDGQAPRDIVRDFLRAGGSYERKHARARAYLTPTGSKGWEDLRGAAILEDAPNLYVRNNGAIVQMIAQRRGRLNEDGSYEPGTASFSFTFEMKKVDGNWRIDNPPDGLLIEVGTFEAAYRSYEVHFLDSTGTRVVPDVRWYAAAYDTVPNLLVTALERGPSPWLEEAVRTDLEGITLLNNVEQEGDRVKVYLTGLGEHANTLKAGGFAQLVWTLASWRAMDRHAAGGDGAGTSDGQVGQVGRGGVEIYVDGRLLAPASAPRRTLQQLDDWRAFSPDGPSLSTGYFLRGGAVWTTKDAPVAGPAGENSFRAASVGVSTDERAIAVVRRLADGTRALYVGGPGSLRATVTGSSLTRPTWGGGSSDVWTVRDGSEVLLVALDGRITRVQVPGLGALGTIRALRLSRDGARVALVAGPRGGEELWVGVVVRESGRTRLEGLRPVEVGEGPVSDVSWSDSLSVVALARGDQQDSSLFAVDIHGVSPGRLVATAGLPAPPTAVAAGPALPLLTVAAGTLWQTPAADETWTRASERGGASAPVYPG